MQLSEYIGETDLEMIHFSLSLIRDVDYKIKSKTFFYKNQVLSYINDCVEHFLTTLHVKCSLHTIYKAEIHQMINVKLKKIYERHCLLSCV
jgi:hypothetical protein